MTRAPAWTRLLPLCVALAALPCGCAGQSQSSDPRPDPTLAGASPPASRPSAAAGPAMDSTARPGDPQRWSEAVRRGREDLRVGNLEAAEESFLAGLDATGAMRPGDVRIEVTLANLQRVAERYCADGRSDDFARVAERVVAASPPRSNRPELAILLVELGELQVKQGRSDEAVASLERALEIRIRLEGRDAATVVDLHRLLGRIELTRGNLDAAALHVERAIEIQEATGASESAAFVDALVDLAALRSAQGREDDAVAALTRALELARLLELERSVELEAQLQAGQQPDPWEGQPDPSSEAD